MADIWLFACTHVNLDDNELAGDITDVIKSACPNLNLSLEHLIDAPLIQGEDLLGSIEKAPDWTDHLNAELVQRWTRAEPVIVVGIFDIGCVCRAAQQSSRRIEIVEDTNRVLNGFVNGLRLWDAYRRKGSGKIIGPFIVVPAVHFIDDDDGKPYIVPHQKGESLLLGTVAQDPPQASSFDN